jgi:hypothetical protein
MKFEIKEIPENIRNSMTSKGIWSNDCPVPMSRLKLLELSHYNFAKNIKLGQMIVLDKVAESVTSIFQELFTLQFPIQNMELIDKYNGDDYLSMDANNSSCFNFRKIDGSELLSMHSYGLAIDINPVQNPYIQPSGIYPSIGKDFLDRADIRAGMVESIVDIFYKHGFTVWGGNWTTPIDYHHFQVPREEVERLIGFSL